MKSEDHEIIAIIEECGALYDDQLPPRLNVLGLQGAKQEKYSMIEIKKPKNKKEWVFEIFHQGVK